MSSVTMGIDAICSEIPDAFAPKGYLMRLERLEPARPESAFDPSNRDWLCWPKTALLSPDHRYRHQVRVNVKDLRAKTARTEMPDIGDDAPAGI